MGIDRQLQSADDRIEISTAHGRIVLRLRVEQIPIEELKNFVPSANLDHSKILINTPAGSGLSGGGPITESLVLSLDVKSLPQIEEISSQASLPLDQSRATVEQFNSFLDHNKLQNLNPARHVDHSKLEIEPGVGLAGGGTLDESRALRLAIHSLEKVAPGLDDFLPVCDSENLHGRVTIRELFELFCVTLKETSDALNASR